MLLYSAATTGSTATSASSLLDQTSFLTFIQHLLTDLLPLPLLPSWIRHLSSLLSSICFPYCSFSVLLLFLLSVCFSPFSPFSFNFFYNSFSSCSLFFFISHRFPCLCLPFQAASLQCTAETLHFPLPPISFLFNGSLFYSSNLLPPLVFLSFNPHTCVPFVSQPCTWYLPRRSTELRFSSVLLLLFCVCHLFYFPSFFLLSLCSYRWFSLSPSHALVGNFLSWNVFPQSCTDDNTSPSISPPTSTLGWHSATENISPSTLLPI